MKKVVVIHGPNLNLLGQRDEAHYGNLTLERINISIQEHSKKNNIECNIFQFNSESDIINQIQKSNNMDGIIINPAAFTHTSVAIRDAIEAITAPVVEVHLSNIYGREEFRHHSLTAPVCKGQVSGLGWFGYILALDYFLNDQ